MEEQNNAGITATASQTGTSKPEQSFTRDQVNKLMQKRVERSHNAFYNRYGVKDLTELDNLFGQASSYGPLKEQFDELTKTNSELTAKNSELNNQYRELSKKYAFKSGNINPDKISDIEAYFKGKNIEIDENNLAKELLSHPEWVTKASSIQPLGAESRPSPGIDERELAEKYLGVKLRKR